MQAVDPDYVRALADQALAGVHREFPNYLPLLRLEPGTVPSPRDLNPAFHGCFDWHSAVHSHWMLVRLLRLFPDDVDIDSIKAALARSITPDNIAAEVQFVLVRPGFEIPYGVAWLLTLAAELTLRTDDSGSMARTLEPLTRTVSRRLSSALKTLPHPIRTGEHNQSAFSMGISLDAARVLGLSNLEDVICRRARDFFIDDSDAPIGYEPSGHDFLSPALAEADLMQRVLPTDEFAAWMERFLPGDRLGLLEPCSSRDVRDNKLVHSDGLNLSRAWMLDGIARGLPDRTLCLESAARHRRAGLEHAVTEHYAGAHWLGTFAVYLLAGRVETLR